MNQVVSVTRLWGSTSGCRARLFRCVWPQTVWAATTQSAGTLSAAVCDLFLLSFKLFTMSTVGSEHVFLTALQPNTSVSTYALPSEIKVGNGGSVSDDSAKARRVQQQIQMRLAEKSTLPRQNGSTSHYAMSGKHQRVFKSLSHGVTPTLSHCSAFPIESCCVRWSVFSADKWWN